LTRAADAGVSEVGIFAAASETFSQRNVNQSIAQTLETYRAVCERAMQLGIRVRAYVSTSFGCPFEGAVSPDKVSEVAGALVEMGAFEVAISDTIGIAHPGQVPVVLDAVLARIPIDAVALHFHDTRGTALANVFASLQHGIATYDASSGGLGGCPYAPGAAGNLATDDLIYMLDGLGIETGVSIDALSEASAFIASKIDHELPSRYFGATRASKKSASHF
jgi:hydroxymethylglutaryl-CoA lyase